MSNIELAAKYRAQLYQYLRDSYDCYDEPLQRNKEKDKFVITCYNNSLKKLGINPDTKEILQEVRHDNNAVYYRLHGVKNSLFLIFYKEFKTVTHVIENKNNYIGKEISCKDFECKGLRNIEGKIAGIGKNSICVIDSKEHKEFFWYLPPPLSANNANGHGVELCKYLINRYGE